MTNSKSSLVRPRIASVYGLSRRRPDLNRWNSPVVRSVSRGFLPGSGSRCPAVHKEAVYHSAAGCAVRARWAKSLSDEACCRRSNRCCSQFGRVWRSSRPVCVWLSLPRVLRRHTRPSSRLITTLGAMSPTAKKAAGTRQEGSIRTLWASTQRTTRRLAASLITDDCRSLNGSSRSASLIVSSITTTSAYPISTDARRGDSRRTNE